MPIVLYSFRVRFGASMKYITYLRVSTQEQRNSGLGIEAQRALVMDHIKQHDGDFVAEFIDYESGKKVSATQRPQLHKALALMKDLGQLNCKLLIARTDRLARDLFFISGLLKNQVPLIVAGHEHKSKLEWQIEAMMAEHEADLISKRTKEALQAAKARGVRLGAPIEKINFASARGGEKLRQKADAYRKKIKPIIEQLCNDVAYRKSGLKNRNTVSNKKISERLIELGFKTMRGGNFSEAAVYNFIRKENVKIKPIKTGRR
jgi:DNA invertase Pin-like site-specific DNA recombinase